MWNCPLCQTENSSMVCACGFDKSRDYEAYPTFGRLSPGLPSISGLTAVEEAPGPRTATVTCPNCGQSAVIREGDAFPTCSKCDASPLNPADQLWAYRAVFNSTLSGANKDNTEIPLKLWFYADKIMSELFKYANTESAQYLADKFDTLAKDPKHFGIDLPSWVRSDFSDYASQAKKMIHDGEIGKNIFDEWEAATSGVRQAQAELARKLGFTVRGETIRFAAFNADDYLRHTQSPLFQDAISAYKNEDYPTARKYFQTAGEQGNPYAAAHLGMMHHNGRGCEKDHAAALECFERGARAGCPLAAAWITEYHRMGHAVEKDKDFAAKLYAAVDPELKKMCDAGDADAQYFRGFNLINGVNIEENMQEGIRLLELAQTQDHKGAAVELAFCYYYGDGVERNYDTAYRLLRENQTSTNKKAQFLLGRCYYHGLGTAQDYDRAFRHFKRAAELGHGAAKDYLGDCYNYGHGTEVDYVEAAKWYHDAANNHKNAGSAYSLAVLYRNGQGVEQNDETAFRYWKTAAEAGHAWSQYFLGMDYLSGERLPKDEDLGMKWLSKAAEQGLVEAMHNLSSYYIDRNTPEDDKKAFEWIQKAAERNFAKSQYAIGNFYKYGIPSGTDYAEAAKWYHLAAEQGEAMAMHELGLLYLDGRGVDRDPDKGIAYLCKALDAGHKPAALELADRYYLGIENYKGQKLYKNPTLAHKYAMLAVQDETDGKAQYRMATIIHHAFGNPAGAKEWYLRAANNGHTEAKLEICKLYIQNREELDVAYQVLRDEIKPDNIAKDKYAEALYWRSVCLENGWGCARNKRQAKELYNKAIEMGYVDTSKKKKRFGLF